jgi:putative addiction module component (TIGR02574 family)
MEIVMDVDTLAREAARLSANDQHALLDRIVDALTSTAERHVAEAWDEEIARRVEDLDSGRATPVPWTEVKQRLHARRASR